MNKSKNTISAKYIQLNRGLAAIVDAEDYQYLSQFRWYALNKHGGHDSKCYAARSYRTKGSGSNWSTVTMGNFLMGKPETWCLDHINGNSLDNRKSNLRAADEFQNSWNRGKALLTNPPSSKYIGVLWHKLHKCWFSYITTRGLTTAIGEFDDEIEAALARDAVALRDRGEFARLNFPKRIH